jgi:hypothetical protein
VPTSEQYSIFREELLSEARQRQVACIIMALIEQMKPNGLPSLHRCRRRACPLERAVRSLTAPANRLTSFSIVLADNYRLQEVSPYRPQCGIIVPSDGSYFAFDLSGTLVGEYTSLCKAMRSIPKQGGRR